jgi:hypothetical protein
MKWIIFWLLLLCIPACVTQHAELQAIADNCLRANSFVYSKKLAESDPKVKSCEDYPDYIKPRLHSANLYFYATPDDKLIAVEVEDATKTVKWRVYNDRGGMEKSGWSWSRKISSALSW